MCVESAAAKTISLNGDWQFVADPTGKLQVQDLAGVPNARPTRVPSCWQQQFADLRDYAGVAWYWRSVVVEPTPPGHLVLLRFAAVDYRADVYVNGRTVGSHEGGYLPFDFDITALLRAGENQIAVRVVDPGPKQGEVEGLRYSEIPHGKQSWYVQVSGLWQDVELDIRPRTHLGVVHITAGADGGFEIAIPIFNPPRPGELTGPAQVGAEIRDPTGAVVWEASQGMKLEQDRYGFSGELQRPALWSPTTPALYTLRVWLSSGDSQSLQFGFRTFEARSGKFYLNGRPIYLRGALDQDFYPDSVYTPPSYDYLVEQMRRAKALGLNMLRCHIKVPDPRYLRAADEVGLLVWYEIPNWDRLTQEARRRTMETLRGMVRRDWNHPSIVVVSIINESWGADLKNAGDREWLKQAYREAKTLVPGWLVVDNSACCDNFHLATDIADFHEYRAIPDHASDFDRLVGDLASRPRRLFSPYADALPPGDEPLVLSEFGNWGLPRVPESKPFWFDRSFADNPITLPRGVEQRFADYGFGSLFKDVNALAEATQWHEYRALKYEIESIRSRPEIQGYVITEFTDLNWEANGLLDMWRRPKVFNDLLAKLQQDDLVIARAEKRNFTVGEKVRVDVHFSHYGPVPVTGGEVRWYVEDAPLRGSLPLPSIASGSGARLETVEFVAPSVSSPSRKLLKIVAVAGGEVVAENSLELFFYPPKPAEFPPSVAFHDPAGRLRRLVNEMRARNYLVPTGKEKFPVLIASTFDNEVRKTLRAGGRVILLAADRQTITPELEVVPRTEGHLDGNWISSFLWVRPDQAPFKSIGFDTLAGFERQAVTPATVIRGVPPENFNDVLAGMFYGWVHSNVAVLVQAKAGNGRLVICTFSLATTYGSDPYATYLLDALVHHVAYGPLPAFEVPL